MNVDDSTPTPLAVAPTRPISVERRSVALAQINRTRSGLAFVWEWTKIFQVSVLLFLLIRTFFVEAFKIPSGSMEGTLLVGDFLLVNKLVYGAEVPFTHKRLPRLREPERGDIMVFEWPEDPTKNFVKRLVGMPGDTLAMRDGVLYRNGTALAERYAIHTDPAMDPAGDEFQWQRNYLVRTAGAASSAPASRNNWGPLVVPERNYFVLGDNRDNSLDSRYWGFVPDSLVKGRPFVIYYSYAPDTAKGFTWLTRVRWHRLGERVH
jgi:signal peptidase I